jgi:hypothetical protein
MPMSAHERRNLLRIERSRDAVAITDGITALLRDNPDVDLLEIEMTFRAAACASYLVATADGFEVIVGMKNWVAALDAFGRTPEVNRQLLAAVEDPDQS